jgi:hypothetical protein
MIICGKCVRGARNGPLRGQGGGAPLQGSKVAEPLRLLLSVQATESNQRTRAARGQSRMLRILFDNSRSFVGNAKLLVVSAVTRLPLQSGRSQTYRPSMHISRSKGADSLFCLFHPRFIIYIVCAPSFPTSNSLSLVSPSGSQVCCRLFTCFV